MSSLVGNARRSRLRAYGIGTSAPVTLHKKKNKRNKAKTKKEDATMPRLAYLRGTPCGCGGFDTSGVLQAENEGKTLVKTEAKTSSYRASNPASNTDYS